MKTILNQNQFRSGTVQLRLLQNHLVSMTNMNADGDDILLADCRQYLLVCLKKYLYVQST